MSNTMTVDWYSQVLKEILAIYPAPVSFNTDQGSQFTADAFRRVSLEANVQMSMDGKGGAIDNMFVERLCRTVQYEEIYRNPYTDGWELEPGLRSYYGFYNRRGFHQALADQPPDHVFRTGKKGYRLTKRPN